jgi:hypothetical protein
MYCYDLAVFDCTFAKIFAMSGFETDIEHAIAVLNQGGTI